MQIYRNKISELLAKMFAIMPKVLPVNKSSANNYLATIYRGVYSLTASVNACYVNDGLQVGSEFTRRWNGSDYFQERFTSYIEAEEARIRRKCTSLGDGVLINLPQVISRPSSTTSMHLIPLNS
jgi:hypothetical protein